MIENILGILDLGITKECLLDSLTDEIKNKSVEMNVESFMDLCMQCISTWDKHNSMELFKQGEMLNCFTAGFVSYFNKGKTLEETIQKNVKDEEKSYTPDEIISMISEVIERK